MRDLKSTSLIGGGGHKGHDFGRIAAVLLRHGDVRVGAGGQDAHALDEVLRPIAQHAHQIEVAQQVALIRGV